MSLWGATAGVASLVGPALGGVLLVSAGWPWIFFVNIPVGIVAFALAWRFVPVLERHPHRFDWLGVALSAAGTFLVVFGIQEGETFSWGAIAGPVQIWHLIAAGVLLLLAFVATQSRHRRGRDRGRPRAAVHPVRAERPRLVGTRGGADHGPVGGARRRAGARGRSPRRPRPPPVRGRRGAGSVQPLAGVAGAAITFLVTAFTFKWMLAREKPQQQDTP